MKIIFKFSILVLAALLNNACKKNNTTQQTPPTPMGNIWLHLHTNIDTTEISNTGNSGKDSLNRKFILNVAQFYMSNISFKMSNGTLVPLTGAYVLKIIGNEVYALGLVPTGNYTAVNFNIGIDPSANSKNPNSQTGVLGNQNPSMWFGNTLQGYIFMNIQGSGDSTGTGNYLRNFSFQLGGNSMYKFVSLNRLSYSLSPVVVTTTSTGIMHIVCDYAKLFKNISSFKTSNVVSTPYNSDSLIINKIASNISSMFRFEE
ncbi:MAG: hypothetical protein JSU07_12175 [Bacteroidetes bacterium]|nr:hypothetical protein [Bacteroidota bacterium]